MSSKVQKWPLSSMLYPFFGPQNGYGKRTPNWSNDLNKGPKIAVPRRQHAFTRAKPPSMCATCLHACVAPVLMRLPPPRMCGPGSCAPHTFTRVWPRFLCATHLHACVAPVRVRHTPFAPHAFTRVWPRFFLRQHAFTHVWHRFLCATPHACKRV